MSGDAKKLARSFCREYLTAAPTADSMKDALRRQGYTVVLFNSAYNDGPTAAIIQALQLQEYVRSSKGFTYADSQHRLVFLHEDLSDQESLLVLLHEQGHISCGHMVTRTIMGQDVLQEHEANEFAHYVLQPGQWTGFCNWVQCRKKPLLIALAVLLCLGIGAGIWGAATRDHYYVTVSGDKYHARDCIFIEGKDNTTQMSLKQLKDAGYTPCEVCNPHR